MVWLREIAGVGEPVEDKVRRRTECGDQQSAEQSLWCPQMKATDRPTSASDL
jgi:hypothetical protein